VRNFIEKEPIPGIVYEYGLNQRFLPEISLEEVNALAKAWMPDRSRLVSIAGTRRRQADAAERCEAGDGD
jgi:zinc protease